jgi:hypothetical protein
MAAPLILIEASPRSATTGAVVTTRLSGAGGSEPSFYLGQHWRRGLAGLPTIVSSTEFDGKDLGGGSVPQAMTVRWAPSSSAALAELAGLHWLDAAMTVRFGEAPSPAEITSGKVIDVSTDDGVLTLSLSDPAADLKKPILTSRFAGTGGIEGPVEWQGKIKRRAWGRVWNLEGECIDAARQIYCFGDPSRQWAEFSAVRDKGANAATLTLLAWQGSIAATWAALQAAVAPQGGGVVCPSIACVKWWTQPAGSLCADIKGEIGATYVETAPAIAERIAATVSAIPFAAGTVAAAVAARPAEVGWVAADENGTAAAALDALLSDVSLMWVLDAGGIILREWAWGTPVVRARSVDVTRKATFRPVSRRRLGYRRNQHVMTRDALAGIVLATDVVFGDGSTVVNLQAAVVQAQSTADTAKGTADTAQGSANTALNALKDTSGNVVPVRDQVAAARAALEASISQAQRDIATAQGLISQLQGSVSGLVTTSIPDLTQRITSAEGINTSQGQLLTTYGTQISNVTSQASTTAGNLATFTQTVQAGNMNLVKNGGFENGLANWGAGAGTWGVATADAEGRSAFCNNPPATAFIVSDFVPVSVGRQYTLSYRGRVTGAGASMYADILWYDASGNVLSGSTGPVRNAPLGFADAGNRLGSVVTGTAPAGAVNARVRIIGQNLPSSGQVAVQLVKLELGAAATPYTNEASVAQAFTAITTANEQVAQLSTTLGTQSTSISSLQTATSNLQGDMATVQTRLVAGSPNLLGNGGFEDGLRAWSQEIGAWSIISGNVWGSYAQWNGSGAQTSGERAVVLYHNPVLFDPGLPFTFTIDASAYNAAGNSYARLEVYFFADAGMTQQIGPVYGGPAVQGLWFGNSPGQNRKNLAVSGVSPNHTQAMWARCRIIFGNMTNDGQSGAAVRQAKFERSPVPTVYSNEVSLTQSYQAISTLDGQRVTMQSQMTTQGSSISSLQSATSTLQGNVAQITQRLVAGNPNLAPNGSGEAGYTQGWHDVVGGWGTARDSWGSYFFWGSGNATADGERIVILDSGLIPMEQNAVLVLSGDANVWNASANAYCRFELIFYSASDQINELGHSWGPNVTQPSFWNTPGVNRQNLAMYATSPAGTAWCRVRFVAANMTSAPNLGTSGAAVRQIKLERGTSVTPYSSEASIYQTYQALSTVSQQYASLSSTVSTQGVTISSQQTAITTLNNNVAQVFGQWVLNIDANGRIAGIKLANNGSFSSLRFRADQVTFESPSGGYRTEYSGGNWRVYDANNVMRVRMGPPS